MGVKGEPVVLTPFLPATVKGSSSGSHKTPVPSDCVVGTGHSGAPDTYKGEMQINVNSCTTSILARKVGIFLFSDKPSSSSGLVLGEFKMQASRYSTQKSNNGDSNIVEMSRKATRRYICKVGETLMTTLYSVKQ